MGMISILKDKFRMPNRYSKFGLAIIIPALAFFVALRILPMVFAVFTSFQKWDLVSPMEFAGLKNYMDAFGDAEFVSSLWKSLYYALMVVPTTLVLSLLLAVLLDRQMRFKSWYRAAYFFPVVTSAVVVSIIWKTMYHPSFGLIANVIRPLGFGPIGFLTSKKLAMPAISLMGVWQSVGFYMVIFLSGLQAIPPHLYEAAAIDGAGRFRMFRNITLPLLRPTLLFALVIATINDFQVFAQVYIMTKGGPADATKVVVYYIYIIAFHFLQMGYASTLSLILLVIILLATLVYMKLLKTEAYY
jgi:ABC-type sugar transport system permease subunit